MAGIEEQRRMLARNTLSKILQKRRYPSPIGIGCKQDIELQGLEFGCNIRGIIDGVSQARDVPVSGIADDQRQTLVGIGGADRNNWA